MADDPDDTGRAAYRNTDTAPFVYFDMAPVFGVLDGVIQIELAARTISPDAGGTKIEYLTTCRLRCNASAAMGLREALDKAVAMLRQPEPAPTGSAMN